MSCCWHSGNVVYSCLKVGHTGRQGYPQDSILILKRSLLQYQCLRSSSSTLYLCCCLSSQDASCCCNSVLLQLNCQPSLTRQALLLQQSFILSYLCCCLSVQLASCSSCCCSHCCQSCVGNPLSPGRLCCCSSFFCFLTAAFACATMSN